MTKTATKTVTIGSEDKGKLYLHTPNSNKVLNGVHIKVFHGVKYKNATNIVKNHRDISKAFMVFGTRKYHRQSQLAKRNGMRTMSPITLKIKLNEKTAA